MSSFEFESFGTTHEGLVRELNEDQIYLRPDHGIWAVADGMGGHEGGEIASAAIVKQLATLGRANSGSDLLARFEDRIIKANDEVISISRQRGSTIGSTIVSLLIYETHFACLWMGDSRLYLVRDGVLYPISRDHSEVQELLDKGLITPEEAEIWPRKNVITRAIGVSTDLMLSMENGAIEDGDLFLLCSDGLTAHIGDDEITGFVAGKSAEKAVKTLLDETLSRGATDNVSIIVVQCRKSTTAIFDM
ncbi:protein phosphatase 2C domain-containing protein [Fulvimarina sp. MAC3]|uniref:PP2C family protein-serine/threonine phosphatase n=1 Tax=Fulvimarina sp. MAC3 TaxID=3148887 RepID=UPI0031FBEACD